MSILASWLASPPLEAALEISPAAVSVAVLGGRSSAPVVQGYAVEPLPVGAVTPSLTAVNISDRDAVGRAISAACQSLGLKPKRVALVIPDVAAKVSLVKFEQLPSRREDLNQLIRWQVKKSTPFAVDDACLTYTPGARSAKGSEFVVIVARREMVREYESVCEQVGIEAGLIDISTFGVINLFLSANLGTAGDWLVVHMRPEYTGGGRCGSARGRRPPDGDVLPGSSRGARVQPDLARRARPSPGRGRSRPTESRSAHGDCRRTNRSHARSGAHRSHPCDTGTDGNTVAAGRHVAENPTRGSLMLRTNLSTRPFYNMRAVHVTLGALAVVVIAMTLLNLVQLVRLMTSERTLGARAQQAEAEAERLRGEARRIRSQIDAKELNQVAAAAQEANAIIDLRTFSWSQLFSEIETTLPENVRLTSFRPEDDGDGRLVVNLRVQARRVQDLESFIDALEKTGRFHQVLATDEQTDTDGLINAQVQSVYEPVAGAQTPEATAAVPSAAGAAGE
jgi:hypothetical protein